MDVKRFLKELGKRKPELMDSEHFSKFAVFLPLLKKNDEYHLLFEIRSMQLRNQPGEICFPGGKMEPDDRTAKETALRETSEELGIPIASLSDIFPLDYMITGFGKRIIYPYVGVIEHGEEIRPNPQEVENVFTVPLSYLQSVEPDCYKIDFKVAPEKNFPFHLIPGGKNYKWQIRQIKEYFYYYQDYVIWGLTASILKHFLDLAAELANE
jgi:8-oxo-dGTP pyrophosphatase MutT (NUDIX family)